MSQASRCSLSPEDAHGLLVLFFHVAAVAIPVLLLQTSNCPLAQPVNGHISC